MDTTGSVITATAAAVLADKKELSLHDLLANRVIHTLTRERQLPQPAGMAPAGSGSRSSVESSDTAAGDGRGDGVGGGGEEEDDPLAAAAAAAAARIGLSAADLHAIRNAERTSSVQQVCFM
jgi:hypothetical protein